MSKVEIKGTIFEHLADYDEREKFAIIEDKMVVGGQEIADVSWQNDYLARMFYNRPFLPIVFAFVQITENEYKARIIVFNYDYHRNMWIALNHANSAGALELPALKILN